MPQSERTKERKRGYYEKDKKRLNQERMTRTKSPPGPSIGSHATPAMKAFKRAVDGGMDPREAVARQYPAIPPDEINKKLTQLNRNPACHYTIEKYNEQLLASFDEEVPPEMAGKSLATGVKLGVEVKDGGYLNPHDHDPRDVTNSRQNLAFLLELSGRKRPEGKRPGESKLIGEEELKDMIRLEKQVLEQRLEKEKAIDVTPEKDSGKTVSTSTTD